MTLKAAACFLSVRFPMHEHPLVSDISPDLHSWYVEEQTVDVVLLLQQEILVFNLKQSACVRHYMKYMNIVCIGFIPYIPIRTLTDVSK
jgi:hypothetical protein